MGSRCALLPSSSSLVKLSLPNLLRARTRVRAFPMHFLVFASTASTSLCKPLTNNNLQREGKFSLPPQSSTKNTLTMSHGLWRQMEDSGSKVEAPTQHKNLINNNLRNPWKQWKQKTKSIGKRAHAREVAPSRQPWWAAPRWFHWHYWELGFSHRNATTQTVLMPTSRKRITNRKGAQQNAPIAIHIMHGKDAQKSIPIRK